MRRLIIIVFLVLFACTNKSIQSKIEDVDRIEIIDKESNFSHTEARKEIIQGFKEVLEVEPEPTDCVPQGIILFKKGNKTRLQVGYYKDASACTFLLVDNNGNKMGHRLSYNTLVYLGVYFQELKKQNDAVHN